MSARRKSPTSDDHKKTSIFEPERTIVDPPRIQAISMKDRPPAIQAISMKTPGHVPPAAAAANADPPTPMIKRPKLRAVSEVTPVKPQQNLGHVAPPYDPEKARARRLREYVIGGCVAVILACAIALVVWFVAR